MMMFKSTFSSSTLLILAAMTAGMTATAAATVDCSQYQSSHRFSVAPITMNYVVSEDGIFSAQIIYEGQGYVAMAISPNGRMRGSLAVIGLPDAQEEEEAVQKYDMRGYRLEDVTPSEQQTLISSDIQQNETHTVLTFSKYMQEDNEVEIVAESGYNYFLVAAGSTNELGYHEHRESVGLRLDTCTTEVEEDTQPLTTEDGVVDCNQYQFTHSFPRLPITMNYVVTEDNVFAAQVIYEGQGYVSWGLSPDGRMTNSMAVIGLPDTGTVDKYFMSGYSSSSVRLTEEQSLLTGSIQQNDTHTVLEFSKYLQGDTDEDTLQMTADGSTTNIFLVAAGSTNNLGFHSHRASVALPLQVCQPGEPISEVPDLELEAVEIAFDDEKSLFKAHGWVSAIAWAVLAPLAITSSLCRHLIPQAGLWFQIHFYANVLVLVLTVVSFALAYRAIQATEGGNTHFQASEGAIGKHKTIGLVVFIVVVLQAVGGIVRPAGGKEKTTTRVLWELTHKGSGCVLLAMGYYQCHSGLVLYANRFVQENDYVNVFWIVAGIITGVGVLGQMHKTLVYQEPPDNNDMTENPTDYEKRRNAQTDSSGSIAMPHTNPSSDDSLDA